MGKLYDVLNIWKHEGVNVTGKGLPETIRFRKARQGNAGGNFRIFCVHSQLRTSIPPSHPFVYDVTEVRTMTSPVMGQRRGLKQ